MRLFNELRNRPGFVVHPRFMGAAGRQTHNAVRRVLQESTNLRIPTFAFGDVF